MQTSIKKIGTLLTVIIILPLIVYSIYELNSLSENEEFLEKIYSEQLNTIIFSVNQYVDDIVQGWSRKTNDIYLGGNSDKIENQLSELCSSNPSLALIVITDSLISNDMQFYSKERWTNSVEAITKMQNILNKNSNLINDLKQYISLGYNKVQSLENELDDTPLLTFLINTKNDGFKIVTFIINMDVFVNGIINKKINSISDEDLIVSIFHNEVLVNNTIGKNVSFNNLLASKRLWSFPNYFLGISILGTTINDIVKERSTINIIVVAVLNLIIVIGVWFVFVNIRKEIKLSQLKSDFVSNVSHEIRTPLSLIGLFAETLELNRVKSEDKKFEYYKIIRKETERLTRIVNTILDLSKMESSSKKFNFEKENPNEIVDEVINTYQFQLDDNGNECIINQYDNLPQFNLDKEAVMEAIINLIDNAIKYSPGKCKIEITTGIEDNSVFIQVEDSGIGISRENQKKIFDKFFRVTSGYVHNSKGSGLGLSLVKLIMKAHNGRVTVESKINKGSKFKLIFPIAS